MQVLKYIGAGLLAYWLLDKNQDDSFEDKPNIGLSKWKLTNTELNAIREDFDRATNIRENQVFPFEQDLFYRESEFYREKVAQAEKLARYYEDKAERSVEIIAKNFNLDYNTVIDIIWDKEFRKEVLADIEDNSIGAIKKSNWQNVYDVLPSKGKNGKSNLAFLQGKSGVYLIKEENNIVYVGSSGSNLYKTILRHFQVWKDRQQPERITYKNDLWLNHKVRVILCPPSKAYELEKKFINFYKPRDNKIQYEMEFEDYTRAELKDDIMEVNNTPTWYPPEWD